MNKEEILTEIKNNTPKEDSVKNIVISFFSGGALSLLGNFLYFLYMDTFSISEKSASLYTTLTFIVLASILTGFGVYDKIVTVMKSGVIVPITGFAHTMTSSAMDAKEEGFIKGIGAAVFKLTGSIILYGIVFGFLVAIIKGVLCNG